MANRVVTKALAGLEDLLLGTGTEVQPRSSGDVDVTKIDAAGLPYENSEKLRTKIGKKIEVVATIAALQLIPTATAEEKYVYVLGYYASGDGGGGFFWLDSSDTSTSQDLKLIFNPDDLTRGRWKRVDTTNFMSVDNGDANLTINAYDEGIQLFATTLTSNRVVTLPSTNLFEGLRYRILRLDTGGFTLAIGSIRTVPAYEAALIDIMYSNGSWVEINYNILVAAPSASTEAFNVIENTVPDMDVLVTAGTVAFGVVLTTQAQQTLTVATADATNPRVDRVVIKNRTGVASIITGTPAGSPSAPGYSLDEISLATISIPANDTIVTNSQITNARPEYTENENYSTGSYTSPSIASTSVYENLNFATHNLGTDNVIFGAIVAGSVQDSGSVVMGIASYRKTINMSGAYFSTGLSANPAVGNIGGLFYNAHTVAQTLTIRWWARKI